MPQPRSTFAAEGRERRAGFTVVELIITMAILVVASGILARTLAGTSGMRTVNRENSLSIEGGRQVLEQMRDQEYRDLFVLYNADPQDDPMGVGTAPGATFAIAGLEALPAAGGQHGEIEMPAMLVEVPVEGGGGQQMMMGEGESEPETKWVWQLREDFVDDELGMPRDLNGDNVIDSKDHSEDYIILPVRVRMSWEGLGGTRTTQLHTMFTEFTKRF